MEDINIDDTERSYQPNPLREQRALRDAQSSSPRDDYHYSDEYGMTLSDAQLKAVKDYESNYTDKGNEQKTAVENLMARLPKESEEEYVARMVGDGSAYPKGTSSDGKPIETPIEQQKELYSQQYIDNFKTTAGDLYGPAYDEFLKNNAKKVTVLNNGIKEAEFNMYKDSYDKFAADMGKQAYYPVAYTKDGGLVVEAAGRGAELYTPLMKHAQDLEAAFIKSYITQVKDEGSKAFTTLSDMQSANPISALRIEYAKKLANMKETIQGLFNG